MANKVPYGFIERTHGLKGRMVLKLFVFGPAEALDEGTILYLDDRELTVVRSRKRDNDRVTVDCSEIWKKSQAEDLRGEAIEVESSQVLKPGFPIPIYAFAEFTIVSRGVNFPVESIDYNTVNPQLMVNGNNGLFPVPLALVLTGIVDSEKRIVTIDLPEGLEDI